MAAPKYIRPGQGDIFSGVFTEGIGPIGGMSPKIGGGGSPGGGGSTTKGNLSKLWNRLMNSISGTKSKDFGNPTMWHNTGKNIIPNQIKSIKDPNIKKQLNDTYWNYLRLDGTIPGRVDISAKPLSDKQFPWVKWKPTVVKEIPKIDPYKHWKGKTYHETDLRFKRIDPAQYTMKPTDPDIDTATVISKLNPRVKTILKDRGFLKEVKTKSGKTISKITNLIKGHTLGKSLRPEVESKREKFAWFRQYKSLIKNLKQYMIDTASPKFLTTKRANSKHMALENKIAENLVHKNNLHEKRHIMTIKKFQKEDKRYQKEIDKARKEMEELKVESKLYHPLKYKEVTYGMKPDPKLPMSIINRIAFGKMNQGGIVGISHLTRSL